MRVEGWELLLTAYLDHHVQFKWGESDCALWAAKWVEQATGEDFTSEWQGRYSTELGAKRLMARRGFSGPGDIATSRLRSRPLLMTRRGDLVLHAQDSLGICYGVKSFFLTEHGLIASPTGDCLQAWAVD